MDEKIIFTDNTDKEFDFSDYVKNLPLIQKIEFYLEYTDKMFKRMIDLNKKFVHNYSNYLILLLCFLAFILSISCITITRLDGRIRYLEQRNIQLESKINNINETIKMHKISRRIEIIPLK